MNSCQLAASCRVIGASIGRPGLKLLCSSITQTLSSLGQFGKLVSWLAG
jgi:hypothetical protein